MENQQEISVGIKGDKGINWYRAHSMTRRTDGAMVVFATDDDRTQVLISASRFAGVTGGGRCPWSNELYPDIRDFSGSNNVPQSCH